MISNTVRYSILAAALAAMAACTPAPPSANSGITIAEANPMVSATRAMTVLTQVCGASLPNFRAAADKLAALGPVARAKNGIVYSGTEDLSIKIKDGPGAGKTCSLVFGSNDSRTAVEKALAVYGPVVETGFGPTTMYKKQAMTFLVDRSAKASGRNYYNIRMLSPR